MCLRLYIRAAVLILALFVGFAHAAPLPAFNGRMGAAVGGVIKHKQSKWGFPANDPRVQAGAAGVGAGLTTIAVGVIGGGVATFGWPALLAAAGINFLIGGGVTLAVNGGIDWIFGDDGSIEVPSGVQQSPAGMASTLYCADGVCAATQAAACEGRPSTPISYSCDSGTCYRDTYFRMESNTCMMYARNRLDGYVIQYGAVPVGVPSQNRCAGIGLTPTDGMCPPSNWPDPGTQVYEDADAAVAALPEPALNKPLTDEMLAAAANTAWRAMDAPDGLPWSPTDPVTPADVAEWRQSNPSAMPSLGDMIAPVAPVGGNAVQLSPVTSPGTDPDPVPSPVPSPGQGEQVDLGPDPNVPPPNLEPIPTAAQILAPLLGLMPDLRNFTVASQPGVCPTGSFDAFERTYVISAHCDLLEENRGIIQAAMLLVFACLAVFIVLRA